jgi:peptidoglycan/LPS O-acetylase OafA/YrhL
MRQTNNFDLLRFLLASAVFLVHAHVLSGRHELAFLSRYLSSELAVEAFFVVSGYLIFRSYESSESLADYSGKRFRRIYPAYAAVVLGCAIFGAFLTQVSLSGYFSIAWLKYVVANLLFLNFLAPDLPGVFAGNALEAVNGALWTLKIEVSFYLMVPFFVYFFRRYGTLSVLAILYIASVAYYAAMTAAAEHSGRPLLDMLARQLPGQLAFFLSGAVFHYYEATLRKWFLPGAMASLLVLFWKPPILMPVLEPICLGFVVLYFAIGLPSLGNFGRFGDFSYGIYIIHFPVVQTLVWLGLFDSNALGALGIGAALILFAAFLSWHMVEKPFLKTSSHYVLAATTREPGG